MKFESLKQQKYSLVIVTQNRQQVHFVFLLRNTSLVSLTIDTVKLGQFRGRLRHTCCNDLFVRSHSTTMANGNTFGDNFNQSSNYCLYATFMFVRVELTLLLLESHRYRCLFVLSKKANVRVTVKKLINFSRFIAIKVCPCC